MNPFARDLQNLLERMEANLARADDEGDRSCSDQEKPWQIDLEHAKHILESALLAAAGDEPSKAKALKREVLNRIAKNAMFHPDGLLLDCEWESGWKSKLGALIGGLSTHISELAARHLALVKVTIAQHMIAAVATTVSIALVGMAVVSQPPGIPETSTEASPTLQQSSEDEQPSSLDRMIASTAASTQILVPSSTGSTSVSAEQTLRPTSTQTQPRLTQTLPRPTLMPTQSIPQSTPTPTEQQPLPTPTQLPQQPPPQTTEPAPDKPAPDDPAPTVSSPCVLVPGLPPRCDENTAQPNKIDAPKNDVTMPGS